MMFISTRLRSLYTPPLQWLRNTCRRISAFADAHHTALIWCFGILYKFALDALYLWAASPLYAYGGLIHHANAFKYAIASVCYFLLFAAIPKREGDSTAFLMHLQFAYTVAPMLTFYSLANGSNRYILMVFLCILLECWLVFRPTTHTKTISVTGIRSYATVALGILVLFTLLIPLLYNGFEGLKAFDLNYIYVMRKNAEYPPGFGYIFNWVAKAILPFAYLFCLCREKYPRAAFLALLQVLLYMETGHKSVLLILFPLTLIFFAAKCGHLLKLMYLGLALVSLLTVFAYQLDRPFYDPGAPIYDRLGVLAAFLFAARALFIPASIKFMFYDCFSQYPKVFFSDGLIGKMLGLTYPYKMANGFIVDAYFGEPLGTSQANTGYLGEAYAQLGFLGLLLMSALLGLILRALSGYHRKETFPMIAALFSIYIIVLNDGALFTTLFTGGMLIAFLLVFIYLGKLEDSHGIQRI